MGMSLLCISSATAATLNGLPAANRRANAAAVPLSDCRAASCRIPRYSFAARDGACCNSRSYARRNPLDGNRSAW